jgi:hypothetical protein
MDMQHIAASATLVKIVDVLRDERELAALLVYPRRLKLRQRDVSWVGRHQRKLSSARVVERVDRVRVGGGPLRRAYRFHGMVLPQTFCVTKGGKTAFGRYSGARQDHDVRHSCRIRPVTAKQKTVAQ